MKCDGRLAARRILNCALTGALDCCYPRNHAYGAKEATDCASGFEAEVVQLIVVAPAVATDLTLPPPPLLLLPPVVFCDHSSVCPLPAVIVLDEPKPNKSTTIAPFVLVVIEVEIELALLLTAFVATASGAFCATLVIEMAPATAEVVAALNVTATG